MSSTFIRFIIVGMINTIIGLSVTFLFFHWMNLSYWMATFLGNSVGACSSFLLNKNFTFKSDGPFFKSLIRFVVIILLCYFISYSIGKTLIVALLLNNRSFSMTIKSDFAILTSGIVYTGLNYVAQKLFVFPKKNLEH